MKWNYNYIKWLENGQHIRCLVPMAIDQSPYFRMTRDHMDKCAKDGVIKQSTILSKILDRYVWK